MAVSDALAEVRAFVLDHADARQIRNGVRLLDALERAIDARVSELLAANNAEVERRRAAEAATGKAVVKAMRALAVEIDKARLDEIGRGNGIASQALELAYQMALAHRDRALTGEFG